MWSRWSGSPCFEGFSILTISVLLLSHHKLPSDECARLLNKFHLLSKQIEPEGLVSSPNAS